jgi:hypothetical protein
MNTWNANETLSHKQGGSFSLSWTTRFWGKARDVELAMRSTGCGGRIIEVDPYYWAYIVIVPACHVSRSRVKVVKQRNPPKVHFDTICYGSNQDVGYDPEYHNLCLVDGCAVLIVNQESVFIECDAL